MPKLSVEQSGPAWCRQPVFMPLVLIATSTSLRDRFKSEINLQAKVECLVFFSCSSDYLLGLLGSLFPVPASQSGFLLKKVSNLDRD